MVDIAPPSQGGPIIPTGMPSAGKADLPLAEIFLLTGLIASSAFQKSKPLGF
jgi:hypothetical protein